jgi:hypothetical protein
MAGSDKKKSKAGKPKGEAGPAISTYSGSLRLVSRKPQDLDY